ncbi:hypothetical protein F2Q68_00038778 [Brassica cretica]|uniref:Uncharacterized protein n=2 Tax=Brassica cretica TaxID=69181 RepID=A0ABQ7A730_BRACR|nr:hypothetical protein F2Q68_00038778 [Brassica cretica]KAF3493489.1 hypothetical protein DY000_02052345 [Brassica cretica]
MAKKKPPKNRSPRRIPTGSSSTSPPPRSSPSASIAVDFPPGSLDPLLVDDSTISDPSDAKTVVSPTVQVSETKSPKSSDLATVKISVPREESHVSKDCSLTASKAAETAQTTHLSASVSQGQNVIASASTQGQIVAVPASAQGQNDATHASTQSQNVAASATQSQHNTAPTQGQIARIFGKRPHAPSQNLVYKPIVNQNNDTQPKAKKISVRKNLPLSNNQQVHQVVGKG